MFSSAVKPVFSAWQTKTLRYIFVHRQTHLQISVTILWLALNHFLLLSFLSSRL